MVAQPGRIYMSVEEYVELDRNSSDVRYEYADGYAYLMSGGTPQQKFIDGESLKNSGFCRSTGQARR